MYCLFTKKYLFDYLTKSLLLGYLILISLSCNFAGRSYFVVTVATDEPVLMWMNSSLCEINKFFLFFEVGELVPSSIWRITTIFYNNKWGGTCYTQHTPLTTPSLFLHLGGMPWEGGKMKPFLLVFWYNNLQSIR